MDSPPAWVPGDFCRRTGVSPVTVRRWRCTGRFPPWARLLIELLAGELGPVDPAWRGWVLRAGTLVSPEDWSFTPGNVRSSRLERWTRTYVIPETNRSPRLELIAEERLERAGHLARITNALEAARLALEGLTVELTPAELDHLFEHLDSTRERRVRSLFFRGR